MLSLRSPVTLATLLLFAGSIAVAQQQPTSPAQDEGRPAARTQATAEQGRAGHSGDQLLAKVLLISNQEEIDQAKLALQHAESEQVKQFAQKMVDDHDKMVQKLNGFLKDDQPVAQRRPPADPTTPRTTAPRDPSIARQEDRGAPQTQRTAARETAGLDFVGMKQEMAEKGLEMARKQWTEKQGAEADRCYINAQVVLHQQMLTALEVTERYASPELQQIIEEGISTTREHLQQAEQLAKQLASAGAGNARDNAASERQNR